MMPLNRGSQSKNEALWNRNSQLPSCSSSEKPRTVDPRRAVLSIELQPLTDMIVAERFSRAE